MNKNKLREQAKQNAKGRENQERRREKVKELSNRAESKAEKAEQKLEQGKGNPVDVALFERQKAIDAKLDAIMAELGIE